MDGLSAVPSNYHVGGRAVAGVDENGGRGWGPVAGGMNSAPPFDSGGDFLRKAAARARFRKYLGSQNMQVGAQSFAG
jgi:hypothetical protein